MVSDGIKYHHKKKSRVIPQLPSIVANYHSPVNSHIS